MTTYNWFLLAKTYIFRVFVFLSVMFLPLFSFGAEKDIEKWRNFLSFSPQNPYFPIFALLGFVLAIATFLRPKIGLYTMLFFIMISTDVALDKGLSKEARSVTIRFEDIILLLVSFGWLLNRAKTRSLAIVRKLPVYMPILAMSCVILIATTLGYIQGTVPLARGFLYTMKRLEYFWIFFMIANTLGGRNDVKVAIYILLTLSVIVAGIGIVQFVMFPVNELTGGGITATAGFGRANTLASLFLVILGVSLGLMICSNEKSMSLICMATFSFLLFALLMTKSRGAYISLPPLLLVGFLVSKSKKILMILIGFALLGLIYFVVGQIKDYRAEAVIDVHQQDIKFQFGSIKSVAVDGIESDSSLYSRVQAWRAALPEIMRYPIFGHGVGSADLLAFDNQYIHEIFDTGFIGLATFLFMNLIIFASAFKLYKLTNDTMTKGLALGFMCGQTGTLSHSLTITNFYTIINMEAFWFVLALLMILYSSEVEARRNAKYSGNLSPLQN